MHRLSFTARRRVLVCIFLSFVRSFVHFIHQNSVPRNAITPIYTNLISPSRAAFPTSRPESSTPTRDEEPKSDASRRKRTHAAARRDHANPRGAEHAPTSHTRRVTTHRIPQSPSITRPSLLPRRSTTSHDEGTTTSTSTSRDDADDDDHPFDRPRVDRGATDVDDDGTTTMDDDPRPRDAREARARDDETRGRGRGRGVVRRCERDDDGR